MRVHTLTYLVGQARVGGARRQLQQLVDVLRGQLLLGLGRLPRLLAPTLVQVAVVCNTQPLSVTHGRALINESYYIM